MPPKKYNQLQEPEEAKTSLLAAAEAAADATSPDNVHLAQSLKSKAELKQLLDTLRNEGGGGGGEGKSGGRSAESGVGKLRKLFSRSSSADTYEIAAEFEGQVEVLSKRGKWKTMWASLVGTSLLLFKVKGKGAISSAMGALNVATGGMVGSDPAPQIITERPAGRPTRVLQVAFVAWDKNAYDSDNVREEVAQLGAEFMDMLEHQTKRFRVYTTSGVKFIRCCTEQDVEEWMGMLRSALLTVFDEATLSEKENAARAVEPLLLQQLIQEWQEYKRLLSLLEDAGFISGDDPVATTKKLKEGYLYVGHMNISKAAFEWKRCYFVLLRNETLYYFENSHDETPKAIFSMRHAAVELDKRMIEEGRFVFHINTPLRTIYLRCKHDVAMNQWLKEIDKLSYDKGTRHLQADYEDIKGETRIDTIRGILSTRNGRHYFKKFLDERGKVNLMKFWRDVQDYEKITEIESDTTRQARKICGKYIMEDGDRCLFNKKFNIPNRDEIRQSTLKRINDSPDAETFTEARDAVVEYMQTNEKYFKKFTGSKYYKRLQKSIESRLGAPAEPISGKYKRAIITYKGKTRNKDLHAGENTIGRDQDNDIVLSDPRVSRSHCRIDIDPEGRCFMVDLGSSRGTKVNGNKCHQTGLTLDSVIMVGDTSIMISASNSKR